MQSVYDYLVARISFVLNQEYERSCKKRITNKDFSIICSTCIGGVIYHRLGMQFSSPTINLWLNQKEFIKMIQNLKWYMSQELEFFPHEYGYPVAHLGGDVTIYFNHAASEEEAKMLWDKRKTRINYDKLYIILYDRDGVTEEDIKSLKDIKCTKLIVLSDKEYSDIDYVKTIKRPRKVRPNNATFLDRDIFGIRTFEKQFDFVSWLNSK